MQTILAGTVLDLDTAGAAFRTQLIQCAVGALFTAAFTYHFGTLITSVATGAQNLNAFAAFAAFGTIFAACTIKASLALAANLIIRAFFALLTASYADDRTFRAAIAAVADLIHAVFT